MNRALGAKLRAADGKETIEESVLRRGGLKTWHRTEVVVRIVAHAGKRHVNQLAVVGLERDPQIERERSVLVSGHPVATAGEHLAAEALAFERAAGDREDRERALRRRANVMGGGRRETQDDERTRIDREAHVRAPRESCRSGPPDDDRRSPPRSGDSGTNTWGALSHSAAWSGSSRSTGRLCRGV